MCKHLDQRYKKTYPECYTTNALSSVSDVENEEEVNRISNIVDCVTKKREEDFDVDGLKVSMLEFADKVNSVDNFEMTKSELICGLSYCNQVVKIKLKMNFVVHQHGNQFPRI